MHGRGLVLLPGQCQTAVGQRAAAGLVTTRVKEAVAGMFVAQDRVRQGDSVTGCELPVVRASRRAAW